MLRNRLLPASLLALLAAAPSSTATLLYVSDYGGSITTLNLTLPRPDHCATGLAPPADGADTVAAAATLEILSSTSGCRPSPAWLTLDYPNSVLYCSDEGLTTNHGTISSFKTSDDGELVQLDKVNTISGPVSAVIYGDKGSGLAVAQYAGSSLSAFNISDPASLAQVQTDKFTIPSPGPVPSRQDAPHPHQAVVDPTGKFVLVPDLGADLVRVFALDAATLKLSAVAPLQAAPGSGPRHVDFLVTGSKTLMYLISELSNTITGYEVSYEPQGSLAFKQFYLSSTYGQGNAVPVGAAAAEIKISPDLKFLTVSSRNESSFQITNPDTAGGAKIPSDSLITFTIDGQTGNLEFLQKFPAGGLFPRQFSMNKAGTLVAVGLQQDSRVVVISRDVATGQLKDIIASAKISGAVTAVIFDE